MIEKVLIIYDETLEASSELNNLLEHIKIHYRVKVELSNYKKFVENFSSSTLALLYLDDVKIKTFLQLHLKSSLKIGFIPNDKCQRTMKSYAISKDIYEALDEAMDEKNLTQVDVLSCNGEIVFTNVVIGDVHGLNYQKILTDNLFSKIKNFYLNLKNLSFRDYTLTTAKGQVIQTAATGVMVLEHNSKSGHYNIINDDLSLYDGKLNAFIISPSNLFSYIYYLFLVTFYAKINPENLPKTLGFIKTSKLDIQSAKPMDFLVDGVFMSAKEINLQVNEDALMLSVGKNIVQESKSSTNVEEEKELVKIKHLPKGEIRTLLLNESVPLFKKAQEEDFKELFSALKESAKPNSVFIVLMILSTLLATTGLFQSSAPVIIGAMILAPLMSPIISLSMGVARGESYFITNSLKTLGFGIATALIFSCIYTYFMPLNILTDEMRGRLNPNILDLMVAIISGIAGAYANAKSEVAKSLAGVAIAVALVPPLSVTGIGLGWGDFDITYGSFLLFLTNLIGITLAAAVTFLILGYAPIHRAKKGIIYTSIMLGVVTVPLIISFSKAITQNNIIAKLNNKTFTPNQKTLTIHLLHVDLSKNKPEIFLQTNSNNVLSIEDLNLLKKEIESTLQEDIILNISANTIIGEY